MVFEYSGMEPDQKTKMESDYTYGENRLGILSLDENNDIS